MRIYSTRLATNAKTLHPLVSLIPPGIVEQKKTSTLADDVVGRIDMTTSNVTAIMIRIFALISCSIDFFGKEINVGEYALDVLESPNAPCP